MCQEPTYFQKVWSDYCLEYMWVGMGVKAEDQLGGYYTEQVKDLGWSTPKEKQ